MKRVVYKSVMFFLLITAGALLLQWLVDHGLKRMTAHCSTQTTIAELQSDTLNADVLIIGNSRALCSYDPKVLENGLHRRVWNIGVSGQPFGISYMRYQLYAHCNRTPQLVIVNIDNNELDMIVNGFGREDFYPYFSDSTIRPYLDLYGFSWKHYFIPMYKYFGDYKLIGYGILSSVGLFPFPEQHSYHGFYNENTPFDGTNLRTILNNDSVIKTDCNPEAIALLDSLLQELRQQNASLLFCYAPQYQPLYQRLPLSETMNAYRELSRKYDIPIVDYSSVEWANDSTFFYNANHINSRGATLFSTRLVQAIDSLDLLH
ncbi:MAG: hypothetical protein II551_04465 [Paludibacteraceae bacterium]|nr:hypothetical protein [Paludibacteraceae bacterium]